MVRGHLTLLVLAAPVFVTPANAAGSGRHHRQLKPTAMEMPAKLTTHEIMMPEPGKRQMPGRPPADGNDKAAPLPRINRSDL